MVAKALGILDIFIGICFGIFSFSEIIPYNMIFYLGLVLLAKGVVFSMEFNIPSLLDIISALIILMSFFGMPKIIVFFVMIFLIQKGVSSLIG